MPADYDPHMRNAILAVFPLLLTFVGAQDLCVTGELQPVPGPTICQQGETHMLVGTGTVAVFLRSNAVNLQASVGNIVTVVGQDIGLLCRVLDVTAVLDPAPVVAVSCGSPSPGCPIRVATQGPGLGAGLLAIAFDSGFTPLGCGTLPGELSGTVLLGTAAELLLAGPAPVGRIDTTLLIPADNALIGTNVGFQGAHMTVGRAGPWRISNVVWLQIAPLLPPCAPLNC